MRKILISTLLLSFSFTAFSQKHIRYFHNGDILTPSNVNSDSLVVTNEYQLNKTIALYEQGYKSFTISELTKVFASNCIKYNRIKKSVKSLVSDGYSLNWAIKKTLVENNVIKEDAEYRSIIED